MSRSKKQKALAIVIESRSQLERLDAAARRLEMLDRGSLERVVAATEAMVAAYDRPDEPIGEFNARLDRIHGARGGATGAN